MLAWCNIMKAQSGDATATTTGNQPNPTGYVALNIGTGTPIGSYGSTSSTGGFATQGLNFDISEGACLGHSNFGLSFKFDYFSNGFDVQSFVNMLAAGSTNSWAAQSNGDYTGETILIGAYATIPIRRFAIDFRLMGGIMLAGFPSIAVAESNPSTGTSAAVGFDACTSNAFAYDIGFDIRWNVSNHICLLLSYDYLSANPTFSTTQESASEDQFGDITESKQPTSINQAYTLLNATFGVGWILGKR